MASEIDICNLALSHLGDTATVASLDPPEGSAQAEHCARFYPIARDTLLELYQWQFATRRTLLAQLVAESGPWSYAYAAPSDALKLLAVLPDGADSSTEGVDFEPEVGPSGEYLILCNTPEVSLRYVALVTDTTRFSPLFVMAVSWQLAALLAGPLLKGDAGAAEAKRCTSMAQAFIAKAAESDANQRQHKPVHNVPWMTGR